MCFLIPSCSQYERQRILDEVDHLPPSDVNAYLVMKIANDYKARPRRKHRKSHGKISFLNLSKTIAHRWKMLDRFVKQHFEKQGKIEAYLYQQRYSQWLQEQENKKNPNHDGSDRKDDSEDGGDSLSITNEQDEQQHVKKKEPPISNTASYPDVELSIESTSKQNLKTGGVHIIMDSGLEKPIMELEEFPSQTTIHFCPLLAKAKHDGYNLFDDVAGARPSDFFWSCRIARTGCKWNRFYIMIETIVHFSIVRKEWNSFMNVRITNKSR